MGKRIKELGDRMRWGREGVGKERGRQWGEEVRKGRAREGRCFF